MKKIKVLVVDDNPKNLVASQEVLCHSETNELLNELGYEIEEVLTANSFVEASMILGTKRVNVLLTDLFMPGEETKAFNKDSSRFNESQMVPYGFVLALRALQENILTCVVTDLNHHAGFLESATQDYLKRHEPGNYGLFWVIPNMCIYVGSDKNQILKWGETGSDGTVYSTKENTWVEAIIVLLSGPNEE